MATKLFRVVPRPPSGGAAAAPWHFRVPVSGALLAGSRHGVVPPEAARRLIDGLGAEGFGFLVGCAPGVDACFRAALARSPFTGQALVGCAFPARARALAGSPLAACLVAPPALHPAAALRRRTLWLVKRCGLAVLFPTDPATGRWGPGSHLVYRAALEQLKPVFVAAGSEAPPAPADCRVARATLYGQAGWWVVPHPVREGGPCDDEF